MRSSSTSCSSGSVQFICWFAVTAAIGLSFLEWSLRSYIHDPIAAGLMAKRVAAIYERRTWPVLGDSSATSVLIGDSQMYTGFIQPDLHAGFFQLSILAETAPML